MFSFGILVCEIMARVDADPDELPRTDNFGLDINKFSLLCPDCPADLIALAEKCTGVGKRSLIEPPTDVHVWSKYHLSISIDFQLSGGS